MRIVHEPFGAEHPYMQDAWERFPREPRAGEPVGIGIVVRDDAADAGGTAAGAAAGTAVATNAAAATPASDTAPAGIRAWAAWSVRGGREQTAPGRFLHASAEGCAFRASLPSFAEGEQVTYSVHATAGGTELHAGPLSFSVPTRHCVTAVISCVSGEGALTVDAATTWQGRALRLRFSVSPQGALVTQRSIIAAPAVGASAPARATDVATACAVTSRACAPAGKAAAAAAPVVVTDRAIGAFRVSFEGALLRVAGGAGARGAGAATNAAADAAAADNAAERRALLREAEPFSFLVNERDEIVQTAQLFESPSDEAFYGFGERFNALNQRGRVIDNRVYDHYCRQGMKTYIPVPFFLSTRGYGHFIETRGPVLHRMDSDASGRWGYEALARGGIPCTHVLAGRPLEIVRGFSALTGRPGLPPDWAFGPWMSGNEWNSQRRVMEVADRTRELGIPASVLVIEAWSDEATFSIWNDARYAPRDPTVPFRMADFMFPKDGLWPDPKAMIDELHGRGIRVVLWQIPVIKKCSEPHAQHDRDSACVRERGWCVKNADGSPYAVRPPWFRNAMVLDFTNPEAATWWFDRRRYLVREMGVDGFKTDGGEHIWGEGARFSDGTAGPEAWNGFVNAYLAGYRRFLSDERGGGGMSFSRAGYTGTQAYPMHWTGDQDSSWESHRSTLYAVLNAGLSGIPFVGWDIGGFAGPVPSAEIYLRSAAMALFSPLMQYHSDFNGHKTPHIDRSPWHIAERSGDASVVDAYRRFARARVAMLPYISAEARHCAETGEPLMRPLFLDWPDDPKTWACADQYLFGRSVLVAPVFEPGVGSREVYLPEGQWECLLTGERLSGGRSLRRPAPLSAIPAFIRAGAEFPTVAVREALKG